MEEHSKLVKEHFEDKYHRGHKYDDLIRNLIPKYEEMHKVLIDSLNFPINKKIKILDLGIGTGETTLRILEKFPNAEIDGIDISEDMLKQAKIRLENYLSKVRFFESDILEFNFKERYDAIVSVLCIHHLNSKQKPQFFKKIFDCMKDEGIFIIADIIKFDSEKETIEKEQEWKKFLLENLGEKGGNFWFENYKEEDLPDSTNNQLKWLKEAGFKEVKCIFEYMNYAVFLGKRKLLFVSLDSFFCVFDKLFHAVF
jgi:tRNA (cmo5U34)-methyltransferase